MRSRGTFRFWKRAPSFTIGLTFRFADYTDNVASLFSSFFCLRNYNLCVAQRLCQTF